MAGFLQGDETGHYLKWFTLHEREPFLHELCMWFGGGSYGPNKWVAGAVSGVDEGSEAPQAASRKQATCVGGLI